MKPFLGVLGLGAVLFGGGCAVEAPYPGGVSVGVYGEYPSTYYGSGYYYGHPYRHYYYGHSRWYHPYDRDHYYHRY